MGGWFWEKIKCERFGRIILKIFIIFKPKSRLQFTYVAFDGVQRSSYFGGEPITRMEIEA